MPEPRKRATDAELIAIVVKTLLDEGTISSQTRLAHLVNRQLKKRELKTTPQRLRKLAIQSGLIALQIRTRTNGPTPALQTCPVCDTRLRATSNRTLTGATTQTGYKCSKCPWWTGRDLRVPNHYTFQTRVTRTEKGQVTFQRAERR